MIFRSADSPAAGYDVFQVFTPTTQARLNFVERPGVNDQLVDALRTPGKQIVVYGETGSGKSTLLQNKLNQLYEGHVVTQCHASMTFDQILLDGFDQLAPFYTDSATNGQEASVSSSLGVDFWKLKANIDANTGHTAQHESRRALPPQLTPQRLGEFMGARRICWVIEDFHKVAPEQKVPLAQSLKVFCDLAREYRDVKVITIGATGTAREVIQYDPEMANRIAEIHVPLMTDQEIDSIVRGGENLLNVDFGDTRKLIVAYSVGVGSICHQLALNCCLRKDIVEPARVSAKIEASEVQAALQTYIRDSSDTLKSRFERALMRHQVKKYDNCKLILTAMANGPLDGMLFSEVLAAIRKEHSNYPPGNLTTYLRALQHDDRGALVRADGSGRYLYVDPFHHLFAHLTLVSRPDAPRGLSDVSLLEELQKQLAKTVEQVLDNLRLNEPRRRPGRQLTLWSDLMTERVVELPHEDDEGGPRSFDLK